jgi:hypothetical protein
MVQIWTSEIAEIPISVSLRRFGLAGPSFQPSPKLKMRTGATPLRMAPVDTTKVSGYQSSTPGQLPTSP